MSQETNGWIPGWELPDSWADEDGLPLSGQLHFAYYSGADQGCRPDLKLRKEACNTTLLGSVRV